MAEFYNSVATRNDEVNLNNGHDEHFDSNNPESYEDENDNITERCKNAYEELKGDRTDEEAMQDIEEFGNTAGEAEDIVAYLKEHREMTDAYVYSLINTESGSETLLEMGVSDLIQVTGDRYFDVLVDEEGGYTLGELAILENTAEFDDTELTAESNQRFLESIKKENYGYDELVALLNLENGSADEESRNRAEALRRDYLKTVADCVSEMPDEISQMKDGLMLRFFEPGVDNRDTFNQLDEQQKMQISTEYINRMDKSTVILDYSFSEKSPIGEFSDVQQQKIHKAMVANVFGVSEFHKNAYEGAKQFCANNMEEIIEHAKLPDKNNEAFSIFMSKLNNEQTQDICERFSSSLTKNILDEVQRRTHEWNHQEDDKDRALYGLIDKIPDETIIEAEPDIKKVPEVLALQDSKCLINALTKLREDVTKDSSRVAYESVAKELNSRFESKELGEERLSEIFENLQDGGEMLRSISETKLVEQMPKEKLISLFGTSELKGDITREDVESLSEIQDTFLRKLLIDKTNGGNAFENFSIEGVAFSALQKLNQKGERDDVVRLLEKNPILAKYACENPADSSTNGILHMIPPQAIESVYGDRLTSAEGKKIAAALEVQDELTTKEILNSIKTESDDKILLKATKALRELSDDKNSSAELKQKIIKCAIESSNLDIINYRLAGEMTVEQFKKLFPEEAVEFGAYFEADVPALRGRIFESILDRRRRVQNGESQGELSALFEGSLEQCYRSGHKKELIRCARNNETIRNVIFGDNTLLRKMNPEDLIEYDQNLEGLGYILNITSPDLRRKIIHDSKNLQDGKLSDYRKNIWREYVNEGIKHAGRDSKELNAVIQGLIETGDEANDNIKNYVKDMFRRATSKDEFEVLQAQPDSRLLDMGLSNIDIECLRAVEGDDDLTEVFLMLRDKTIDPHGLVKYFKDGKIDAAQIIANNDKEAILKLASLNGFDADYMNTEGVDSGALEVLKKYNLVQSVAARIALEKNIFKTETDDKGQIVYKFIGSEALPKIDRIVNAVTSVEKSNSRELRYISNYILDQFEDFSNEDIKQIEQIVDQFERGDKPGVVNRYSAMKLISMYGGVKLMDMPPSLGEDSESEEFEKAVLTDAIRVAAQSNSKDLREYLQKVKGAETFMSEGRDVLPSERGAAKRFSKIAMYASNFIEDVHNSQDILDYMDSFAAQMDERHRSYVEKGEDGKYRLRLDVSRGDLIKGIDLKFSHSAFENGYFCPEMLGGDSAFSDATHLDVDFAYSTEERENVPLEKHIYSSIAASYGGGMYAFIKPDERYTISANGVASRNQDQLDKIEINRSRYMNFSGITTGIGQFNVDLYGYDSRKLGEIGSGRTSEFCHSMVLSGVYTPIVDIYSGEVLFTPEQFDEQRDIMIKRGIIPDPETGESHFELADDTTLPENLLEKYGLSYSELCNEEGFKGKIETNNSQSEEIERRIIERIEQLDVPDSVKEQFVQMTHSISRDFTKRNVESLNTGSTGRNTNLPNDADFDYTWRLDRKTLDAYGSRILNSLYGSDNSVFKSGKESRIDLATLDLRKVLIEIDGKDVEVDISMRPKGVAVLESTDVKLAQQLDQIRKQDESQYRSVIANIVAAKKMLKKNNCYKGFKSDNTQGGMGGIGVENWILNNGGSLTKAAQSYVDAINQALPSGDIEKMQEKEYQEFCRIYQLWDYGENLFSEDKKAGDIYPYDNLVERNMSMHGCKETYKVCQEILAAANQQ